MTRSLSLAYLVVCICCSSCKSSFKFSYEDQDSPKFEGDFRIQKGPSLSTKSKSIKVVSFNIEFARHMEDAISLIKESSLSTADVFLLQEMDETATKAIADSLQMAYVYYPAIYHPGHQKNVGNAILSKHTIRSSHKIKLPFPSLYPQPLKGKNYRFRKTATVATIEIGNDVIQVASTHAAAFNPTERRRQFAQSLVNQLSKLESDKVIVAGDFNSLGTADIEAVTYPFIANNFIWASETIGHTVSEKKHVLATVPTAAFQLDHIFTKGVQVENIGKLEQQGVSDHLPIWVEVSW